MVACGGCDLAFFAGTEETKAVEYKISGAIEGGLGWSYFSQVSGVLSLKSSIVMRPAGWVPIAISKKTRGRTIMNPISKVCVRSRES